ncbi:MAG: hypothetical protein WCW52_12210 [Elusimicrobiales bacterium]
MEKLTAELRSKAGALKLNGMSVQGETISRALALLPRDRARAGTISFEIEEGPDAGIYQCEALGRGATSDAPRAGWPAGLIDGVTIYYAPQDETGGATVPGVYDLRNITPDRYEIAVLDAPDGLRGEEEMLARIKSPDNLPKPYFAAVYKHWYNKGSAAAPVDMMWAGPYNSRDSGPGAEYFERRPAAASPEARSRQAAQLAHDPRYYYGPYGRSGFAVHTDRWEAPERKTDPRYAGRLEIKDFRFRDTSGCLKLRPGCLLKLNEFISGQEKLGRRVQLEVRETPLMDAVPQGPSQK